MSWNRYFIFSSSFIKFVKSRSNIFPNKLTSYLVFFAIFNSSYIIFNTASFFIVSFIQNVRSLLRHVSDTSNYFFIVYKLICFSCINILALSDSAFSCCRISFNLFSNPCLDRVCHSDMAFGMAETVAYILSYDNTGCVDLRDDIVD